MVTVTDASEGSKEETVTGAADKHIFEEKKDSYSNTKHWAYEDTSKASL